jgi:hypothetical protein
MEFSNIIKPKYGDQIRVNRGLYYHHGIYVDDSHVIQFGSPTNELNPATAEVMIVSLDTFLRDSLLEVRVLNDNELKEVRTPNEIVNYAMSKLGTKGYSIISNNCEHFASECLFGKRESDQVNKVFSFLEELFKPKN